MAKPKPKLMGNLYAPVPPGFWAKHKALISFLFGWLIWPHLWSAALADLSSADDHQQPKQPRPAHSTPADPSVKPLPTPTASDRKTPSPH